MMEGWNTYTLEQACERIYSGGTPSTKHPEYWNGNLKWLSSGETSQRFIYDTERKITQEGVNNSSTKLAKKGCTVIATAGQGYTRGQASFLMTDTYMNQSVIACKANENVVLPLYLYYNLNNRYEEFRLLSDGTSTRGGLSGWILKRMDINLPPLDVQAEVVSILYSIDQKIEENERINKNLYQQVVALYSSLFGKPAQQTSSVGQYSEQIYSGGTPSTSKSEYWNGEFHWFSSGETRNRFAITTDKTITKAGVDNSSTKLAHKYDIVMASAGQGFTRGQTTMLLLDTYVNQSVIVIHANHTVLPYLFWNLAGRYDELRAISDSSSIRGSLTTKMIAGFVIPEVDSESLAEFSEFAWPVISEIENNLLENQRLSTLRDTLLPRLMSGEIDISDIDL
jgi:type I restriction enzyme S subunit